MVTDNCACPISEAKSRVVLVDLDIISIIAFRCFASNLTDGSLHSNFNFLLAKVFISECVEIRHDYVLVDWWGFGSVHVVFQAVNGRFSDSCELEEQSIHFGGVVLNNLIWGYGYD